MTPICCVGETLEEHHAAMTKDRLSVQVEAIVAVAPRAALGGLVIAYEPIWAIGTGEAATPDDAQEACSWIREVIAKSAGVAVADQVRIQYGGSVNPENTDSLVSCAGRRRRAGGWGQPRRSGLRRDHPGRGPVHAVSLVAFPAVSRLRRTFAC